MKEGFVSIKELRKTHFEQIYEYILDAGNDGSYYGDKEHYFKRHEEIKRWIKDIINNFDKEKR